MAVTVVDPFRNYLAAAQQAGEGLESLGKAKRQREALEEQKLSGIFSRAYQEALGEQAEATAEATRIKNKVLQSLPKKVLQGIYTNESENLKNQIFLQDRQISMQAKVQALKDAQATSAFKISQEQSQAEIARIKASSAQVMQAFDTQLKQYQVKEEARNARLADFNDVTKDMGVAGTNAAREAYMAGKPINEIGEIGLAADQEASQTQARTEQLGRVAEQRRKEETKKGPSQKKVEAKEFGSSTYERRQAAIENVQPTAEVLPIFFDKTPGRFAIGGKGDYKIDYQEAKELGKEKEWLDKYESIFNEPYDIPESQKTDIEKTNGQIEKDKDKGPQPPASVIKVRDAKYPGKEIIFRDGKWGIVQ